jgi:hypothetical protein
MQKRYKRLILLKGQEELQEATKYVLKTKQTSTRGTNARTTYGFTAST